jgi:AcrR family transcriptional regulator
MATQQSSTFVRRRDRQRDETRRNLAFAALDLASARGLANVRVPDIAAAAGVSSRTFNNYFPSKEAAIAWPAARRAARLADNLLARPDDEPLGRAIVAAVSELYEARAEHGFPSRWLRRFRALVAREPALYGEYLKAADAGERALAHAIRIRTGAAEDELEPKVLAALVFGAERAAIRHWMSQSDKPGPLVETVRAALHLALQEVER